MMRIALLVFACVAVLAVDPDVQVSDAESDVQVSDAEPDAQASEAEPATGADSDYYPRHDVHRSRHDDHEQYSHRHEHGRRDYKEIIERVYSPDYYEPTVILDYRYLKSGGRDYVRGPGGQIIILPHGIRNREPKEFPDYDSLIDHLRHKNQGRAFREEDVSRINKIDHHRPWFNQIDNAPHHQHDWH